MKPEDRTRYFEKRVALVGTPLSAVYGLVRDGGYAKHVVYERDGRYVFAGGALAEVIVDQDGVRLESAGEVRRAAPADPADPLTQIRGLLVQVPVTDWRAYGWAAFELGHAAGADPAEDPGQRLLHLVVPEVEVRLEAGKALLRTADPARLEHLAGLLGKDRGELDLVPSPQDVRTTGRREYEQVVASAVNEIRGHQLDKVILSRRVEVAADVDLAATYVSGRRGNTPARSFLLRLDGLEAVGFSPEIVVRVEPGGRVVSQPLAGTRALSGDQETDRRLRDELISDAKEVFEHAISVRRAVADLTEVCRAESVVVEEFMAVRDRGTVQHLASRVTGELAAGQDRWDAFRSTFPAVTASGIPRKAAFASIRRHERAARGLYSGAVLALDQAGGLDAALVLRAVYRQAGRTWLQAGAGLVSASRPTREFEETCEKLDSVARFLIRGTAGPADPALRTDPEPAELARSTG